MTSSGMPDGHWEVDRDDSVAVLRYDGGTRRTLGIDGAGQLAALLDERSARRKSVRAGDPRHERSSVARP